MEKLPDRIDRALLMALQKDGRLSNKELAALVGLSPSSCLERVRRLRSSGQLRGIHAAVAPEALGISLQAMIFVQLDRHSEQAMQGFQQRITPLPGVVAIYHVAGQHDFLVHVVARDAAHLRTIVLDELSGAAHVRHIETALIFDHSQATLPDYSER